MQLPFSQISYFRFHISYFIFLLLSSSCTPEAAKESLSIEKPSPSPDSRIAWDYSTLTEVSSQSPAGYNGYARVIQLHDRSLLCVYESSGNIVTVKSEDMGENWSAPVIVASQENGINMAVPDVLQLADSSILVCYNPRPFDIDPSRKFSIRIKKSYDGGLSWQEERLLYEAGFEFKNGCWEPSAIQLPNGEIQLFFANEGPYTESNEQEISLLRSWDGGESWTTEAETVSFRAGARDGMPAPLLLQNQKEVIIAIEDNGKVTFKPYIVRSTVENNWSSTITGGDSRRTYALADPVDEQVYAGAPYLGQLSTGETLLSYQGTEGRPSNEMRYADMKVTIGSAEGYKFNRKTTPFIIPGDKSCLWNSIAVTRGDTVIALTSTNAFSENREVWMIKGYLISALKAIESTISVDNAQNEPEWKKFQVFTGHKGPAQLRSNIAYDNDFLYILNEVKDDNISGSTSSNPEGGDGVTIYLNMSGKSFEKPDKGIFSIYLSADNKVVVKEGSAGVWEEIKIPAGINSSCNISSTGYFQEIAIPWSFTGGKPGKGDRIGFNLRVTQNSGNDEQPEYHEDMSSNDAENPSTWNPLTLE